MLLHIELTDERYRLEERVMSRTHELHIANKELQLLATTDSLTGLPNRRSMMDWIETEIERAGDTEKPLALCMIDVDHFKKINDTYGHATGDRAIIAIANACSEIIRKTDIAARFGGEEFVLLMPQTDLTDACNVAERLRQAIASLTIHSDDAVSFGMTISVGVALFDAQSGADRMSSLLSRADNALYRAKSAGRNQVVFS
jgi:diguanylate cyclase (GGDEF)-like protein